MSMNHIINLHCLGASKFQEEKKWDQDTLNELVNNNSELSIIVYIIEFLYIPYCKSLGRVFFV